MLETLIGGVIATIFYKLGYKRGAEDTEYLCHNAAQVEREFFSRISRG